MEDILVIGGGPGGYAAALRAGALGAKVTLVERGRLGGTCLNRGCIPTKALLETAAIREMVDRAAEFGIAVGPPALRWEEALRRKQAVVDRLVQGLGGLMDGRRVRVVYGNAEALGGRRFQVGEEVLEGSAVIIATGSRPSVPPLAGLPRPGVLVSDEILDWPEVPESLIILGAGVIGLEFASLFSRLGTKVLVLEALPDILPGADREMVRRLRMLLRARGIEIRTGATVEGVAGEPGSLRVTVAGEEVTASIVLLATGRRPDLGGLDPDRLGVRFDRGLEVDPFLRTRVPGIFGVGDVLGGEMLAHVAMAQGLRAVGNILGELRPFEPRAVPKVIYTAPEMAWVGVGEEDARQAGLSVQTANFPLAANGRALTLGEPDGVCKLVVESGSRRVLGLHLLGAGAAELVHEGVLAIENGLPVEALAEAIHAHPTLAESVNEVAHGLTGGMIHALR